MAQQTINIGTIANDGTGDPLRTAFDKANQNFTEVYAGLGVPDGSVTYAKLADEFTDVLTSTTSGTVDIDWGLYTNASLTLSADTTLTFSNLNIGDVKTISATGDFTLTLPNSGANLAVKISGDYDGTVSNFIQISKVGFGIYWYSISQPAA